MEAYGDWTDLLPFFSGFTHSNITNHAEDDGIQSTVSPVGSPVTPQPTPVFETFSLQLDETPHDSPGTTYFVSTAFPAHSPNYAHPTDIILLSSDSVFFHVHRAMLQVASKLAFRIGNAMSSPEIPVIVVSEASAVLNIVLHTIYGRTCSGYSPSFEDLSTAVFVLVDNDIVIEEYIASATPLGILILTHAPRRSLEVYILAGRHYLNNLAITASRHLLSCNLSSITDNMAVDMGPIYLRRLFTLHSERLASLRLVLMPPPHPHPETPACEFSEQNKVARAWALASAYLIWDSRVDLTANNIRAVITPMEEHLRCLRCRENLRSRTNTLVLQWASIKETI
ncbi:hypothetical protein BJ138DRAFT_1118136 [Hygrophoropsis aurantiaca]|uniref:Uncharacterized protein n=1 Tax=Hygrophoropsis aurantiaca TaxID=72124 RepID=A0ACB7ZY63_9AGAM|nr:hypothetical protein BJ138DRAFT_1118136 [Hygrophoropsis aurantiaca]